LAESERRDFLEICEDRYNTRSTILTSQIPIADWHQQIGDPTLADSILDRLVHNAHRLELAGGSMRKRLAASQDSWQKVLWKLPPCANPFSAWQICSGFPPRGFSQGLENSSLRSAVSHTSHSLYDCFTHIF